MLYQEIVIKLARRTSVNLFLHFFSQASGGKHARDTKEEGAPPLTLPSHSRLPALAWKWKEDSTGHHQANGVIHCHYLFKG